MTPPPPPAAVADAGVVAHATHTASQLQEIRSRGRLGGAIAVLGPAFVACIAYVDPGNFATNIAGGAQFGYLLLWVLLAANLMAMLIQNLSAKIGIATGKNLPDLCREHFRRPVTLGNSAVTSSVVRLSAATGTTCWAVDPSSKNNVTRMSPAETEVLATRT